MNISLTIQKETRPDFTEHVSQAVEEGSVRSYKNAVGGKTTRFPAGEPASLLVR